MSSILRRLGRAFTYACTAVVLLAGGAVLMGWLMGTPVRPVWRVVSEGAFDAAAVQPAPGAATPLRSAAGETAAHDSATTVQNVILFIGDGMGLSQVGMASLMAGGPGTLALEGMPVTGFVRTYAANDLLTDSAAGATAMATGYKTYNGAIGVDADGAPRATLLEAAAAQGFATGVVTTSYLVDASAAAFVAHAASRGDYAAIARQMVASEADVLLGGDANSSAEIEARAQEAGVRLVRDEQTLRTAPPGRLLGLFPPRTDGPGYGPDLATTLAAALDRLQAREGGFVLVAEQEGTDTGAHGNDLGATVRSVQALDRAVRRALTFARADGRTLVLVTADHDTGGPRIVGSDEAAGTFEASWATFSHTAQWVPLFAAGPGSARFTGVLDNTDLPRRLGELLDLPGFPEAAGRPAEAAAR